MASRVAFASTLFQKTLERFFYVFVFWCKFFDFDYVFTILFLINKFKQFSIIKFLLINRYADYMKSDGWDVDMLAPSKEEHVYTYPNPYNPHIDMMSVKASFYWDWAIGKYAGKYDVVHAVCPLNVSAFLIFFIEAIRRLIFGLENSPRLVTSYHTNCGDCYDYFAKKSMWPAFMLTAIKQIAYLGIGSPYGFVVDRMLTPTMCTEPGVTKFVHKSRRGISASGVDLSAFQHAGPIPEEWTRKREQTLKQYGCNKLLVYVGRVLKKNLASKIFGYLARCEFWLKLMW